MLFLKIINRVFHKKNPHRFVGVFCCCCLAFSVNTEAQTLEGKFNFDCAKQKIFLEESIGFATYRIDSAVIMQNKFRFNLKSKSAGYYKLTLSGINTMDFILNKEDSLVFHFNDSILINAVEIKASKENQTLWNYKYFSRQIQHAQKQLIIAKSYLATEDSISILRIGTRLDSLESVKQNYLLSLCQESPNSYFSKVVGASLPPKIPEGKTEKDVFFDNVDFSDENLIRSSVFPSAMMGYLEKHTEYNEEGFGRSISEILAKASVNPNVYEFCLNFLLELFNRVGPDVVFQHIVEKYLLEEGCSDVNISESMKDLASGYRVLMSGNQAPDIAATSSEGKQISLYDELKKSQKTILFFWSSHCSFCHAAIPGLKKWEEENKADYQVIAFSLDTSEEEWKNYILENELDWINISELKGWGSDAVKAFKVHKTPSYYLLGPDGTIMSKSKTINEIVRP